MSSRSPQTTIIMFSRSSSKSRLKKESSLKRCLRRAHSPTRIRTYRRAWLLCRARTFSLSGKSPLSTPCNRQSTGMCLNRCSFLKAPLTKLVPNKELVGSLLTSSRRLRWLHQASSNKQLKIRYRRSALLQLGLPIRFLDLKIRISSLPTISSRPLSSMVWW